MNNTVPHPTGVWGRSLVSLAASGLLAATFASRVHASENPDDPASTAVAEAPATAQAGYDNGFFVASPDDAYRLRFNVNFQVQHRLDVNTDVANDVFIRRLLFIFSGQLYDQRLRYTLAFGQFPGVGVGLFVGYGEWAESPWLNVRVGKFKIPFDFEFGESHRNLQFVDRSFLSKQFGGGLDTGVMAYGQLWSSLIGYQLFATGGSGSDPELAWGQPRVGLRLSWDSDRTRRKAFWSTTPTESFVTVGVAVLHDPSVIREAEDGSPQMHELVRVGTDVAARVGPLSVLIEGMLIRGDEQRMGLLAQSGVIAGDFEFAARWAAAFEQREQFLGESNHEFSLVTSYFIRERSMKLQIDYTAQSSTASMQGLGHLVRSQFQIRI